MEEQLRVLRDANASFVTERLVVGGDLDITDPARAMAQLSELREAGVTHVVDCRLEAEDEQRVRAAAIDYRWDGIDDAGQRVPAQWFDEAVGWVLDALEDPDAIVLTHCHMGINRGPSLGYAVLLALGTDPVEAIQAIRHARPQAYTAYAEDALRWHHDRTDVAEKQRVEDRERVARWRDDNEIDLVRIIADQRARGQ